jgi:hypothetical protein
MESELRARMDAERRAAELNSESLKLEARIAAMTAAAHDLRTEYDRLRVASEERCVILPADVSRRLRHRCHSLSVAPVLSNGAV